MRIQVSIVIILFVLCGCNSPKEVNFADLTAVPNYKREEKDGKIINTRIKNKRNVYHYNGKPFTGKTFNYYKKLKQSEGEMADGFQHGLWKFYHSDGKVQMTGNYKDGVVDSIWKYYYKDGTPHKTVKYYLKGDNLICDTLTVWYRNRQLMLETSGDTLRTYFITGKLASIAVGKPPRVGESFSADGFLETKIKNYKKTVYNRRGEVTKRVYYLIHQEGRDELKKDKYKFTEEQLSSIEEADSIEFDNTRPYDPLLKIYLPD